MDVCLSWASFINKVTVASRAEMEGAWKEVLSGGKLPEIPEGAVSRRWSCGEEIWESIHNKAMPHGLQHILVGMERGAFRLSSCSVPPHHFHTMRESVYTWWSHLNYLQFSDLENTNVDHTERPLYMPPLHQEHRPLLKTLQFSCPFQTTPLLTQNVSFSLHSWHFPCLLSTAVQHNFA